MLITMAWVALLLGGFLDPPKVAIPDSFQLKPIPELGMKLIAIELGSLHARIEIYANGIKSIEMKFGKDSARAKILYKLSREATDRRDALETLINETGDLELRSEADRRIRDALKYQREIASLTGSELEKRLKHDRESHRRDMAAIERERDRLIRIRDGK
jgi:hypothetical protein